MAAISTSASSRWKSSIASILPRQSGTGATEGQTLDSRNDSAPGPTGDVIAGSGPMSKISLWGPVRLLRQRVEAPIDVRIPRHMPAGGTLQLVRLFHREEGEQIGDPPAETFGAREACRDEAAVVRERFGDGAVGRRGAARRERRDVDDARGGEAGSLSCSPFVRHRGRGRPHSRYRPGSRRVYVSSGPPPPGTMGST